MTASEPAPATRESGFTLLEVLIAMIVLAVGGVSILSLFAAAVAVQYDSVVGMRQADVVAEAAAEAQRALDGHAATPDAPLPPDIKRKPSPAAPADFEVEISFHALAGFPEGEGAKAVIRVFHRGVERDPVVRILQRTAFSTRELEESVSLERDRRADAEAAERKKAEEGNRPR